MIIDTIKRCISNWRNQTVTLESRIYRFIHTKNEKKTISLVFIPPNLGIPFTLELGPNESLTIE